MKYILSLSCAVVALSAPFVAGAAESHPVVNTEDVLNKIRACKALQDEKAYEAKKADSYYMMVLGKDGWFFRTKSDFKRKYDFAPDRVTQLLKFQKALAEKGTQLYVAYLPSRGLSTAQHHPEVIPSEGEPFDFAKAKQSRDDGIASLRGAGINVITYDKEVNPDAFFRKTDHHWSVNGAREYAKIVAEAIKKDSVYKDITKTAFITTSKGTYFMEGRFNDVTKGLCGVPLAREQDEDVQTFAKGAASDAKGLFGDAGLPQVVLVGTSFSKAAESRTNFDGFLKEYLQADVMNAAISGGGIDEPMVAYLNSKEFKESPPKVIIWEIPGNYSLSKEEGRFLDELAPAVVGDCAAPALEFRDIKVSGQEMPLVTGLEGKNLQGGKYYVRLLFSAPVDKNFSVFFKYKNSDEAKHRFKRSKRFPHDGLFYSILPVKEADGKGPATLSSIELGGNEKTNGLTVSGKICALP